MTDRLDLPRRHRDQLEALLRAHLPGVDVWAYGSRVNGRSHDGSDLDLVLRGPGLHEIPVGQVADFAEAMRESSIPFLVEARDWARLPERFQREIERGYVVLVEGESGRCFGPSTQCLGDVAEIVMGQSPPGKTVSEFHGLALLNGPTEFGAHHPVPVQFTTDARKFADKGDLLFCVRGSTTGRMNWADQRYAIGRGVAAIRHRHETTLQPFIRAVIEFALPELLTQATGSTFPNVSAHQLAAIPYPNLDEEKQRAIAHILGTLDDKIELNRRMNATLEGMARALFQSWFVDFDPVRAKAALRRHAAGQIIPLKGGVIGAWTAPAPTSTRWTRRLRRCSPTALWIRRWGRYRRGGGLGNWGMLQRIRGAEFSQVILARGLSTLHLNTCRSVASHFRNGTPPPALGATNMRFGGVSSCLASCDHTSIRRALLLWRVFAPRISLSLHPMRARGCPLCSSVSQVMSSLHTPTKLRRAQRCRVPVGTRCNSLRYACPRKQ